MLKIFDEKSFENYCDNDLIRIGYLDDVINMITDFETVTLERKFDNYYLIDNEHNIDTYLNQNMIFNKSMYGIICYDSIKVESDYGSEYYLDIKY